MSNLAEKLREYRKKHAQSKIEHQKKRVEFWEEQLKIARSGVTSYGTLSGNPLHNLIRFYKHEVKKAKAELLYCEEQLTKLLEGE